MSLLFSWPTITVPTNQSSTSHPNSHPHSHTQPTPPSSVADFPHSSVIPPTLPSTNSVINSTPRVPGSSSPPSSSPASSILSPPLFHSSCDHHSDDQDESDGIGNHRRLSLLSAQQRIEKTSAHVDEDNDTDHISQSLKKIIGEEEFEQFLDSGKQFLQEEKQQQNEEGPLSHSQQQLQQHAREHNHSLNKKMPIQLLVSEVHDTVADLSRDQAELHKESRLKAFEDDTKSESGGKAFAASATTNASIHFNLSKSEEKIALSPPLIASCSFPPSPASTAAPAELTSTSSSVAQPSSSVISSLSSSAPASSPGSFSAYRSFRLKKKAALSPNELIHQFDELVEALRGNQIQSLRQNLFQLIFQRIERPISRHGSPSLPPIAAPLINPSAAHLPPAGAFATPSSSSAVYSSPTPSPSSSSSSSSMLWIDSSRWQSFLSSLSANESLTELQLHHSSLSPAHIQSLFTSILHHPALSKLILAYDAVTDKSIDYLIHALSQNPAPPLKNTLATLNLSHAELTRHGVAKLARSFSPNFAKFNSFALSEQSIKSSPQKLSFTGNLDEKQPANSGSGGHPNVKREGLDFEEKSSLSPPASPKSPALQAATPQSCCFPNLTKLDLSENMATDEGIVLLSRYALSPLSSLRILDLSKTHMREHGAFALADALLRNSRLRTLSVMMNNIGGTGFKSIVEALCNNPRSALRDLNVAACHIHIGRDGDGREGMNALAKLISSNTCLQSLDLRANDIDRLGIVSLASSLIANNTLLQLNLAWTMMEVSAMKALCHALAHNRVLTSLNLSNCMLKEKHCQYLGEMLKKNRSLTSLNLSLNGIDEHGAQHLAGAFQTKSKRKSTHGHKSPNPTRANSPHGGARSINPSDSNATAATNSSSSSSSSSSAPTASAPESRERSYSEVLLSSISSFFRSVSGKESIESGNNVLRELNLRSNHISDQGVKYFCDALRANESLHVLNLTSNPLTTLGVLYLVDLLEVNFTLLYCGKFFYSFSNALKKNAAQTHNAVSNAASNASPLASPAAANSTNTASAGSNLLPPTALSLSSSAASVSTTISNSLSSASASAAAASLSSSSPSSSPPSTPVTSSSTSSVSSSSSSSSTVSAAASSVSASSSSGITNSSVEYFPDSSLSSSLLELQLHESPSHILSVINQYKSVAASDASMLHASFFPPSSNSDSSHASLPSSAGPLPYPSSSAAQQRRLPSPSAVLVRRLLSSLLRNYALSRESRQIAFLMGFHSRLGAESSVFRSFCCHRLCDMNLVPVIFSYVGED